MDDAIFIPFQRGSVRRRRFLGRVTTNGQLPHKILASFQSVAGESRLSDID